MLRAPPTRIELRTEDRVELERRMLEQQQQQQQPKSVRERIGLITPQPQPSLPPTAPLPT